MPDDLLACLTGNIRDATVYDLAQGLHVGIPHGPTHSPYLYSMIKKHGQITYRGGVSSVTDMFSMGCHVGTHFDALGHVSCEGMLHGDVKASEVQDFGRGLSKHGAQDLKPVVARGILLDVPKVFGRTILDGDQGVGPDEIARCCEAGGVEIGEGDAVLIRTGWAQQWPDHAAFHSNPCPGLTLEGANWLGDRGVCVIGGDNYALELVPSPGLPVHVELLVRRGIPIIEMLNLEALSESGASEFTFVALPLKIEGGSGAPTRPVAIVGKA